MVFFCWKVLALGLRDAAFIFTQLTKPIMAGLRRKGFRCCIYIDDKLTVCQGYDNCLRQEQQENALFVKAGWVFKREKRSGDPAQILRFLGLLVDSINMCFTIPKDKLSKIKEEGS